jgi:aminoglycoside phosphotransferase (APT) family kinase protein
LDFPASPAERLRAGDGVTLCGDRWEEILLELMPHSYTNRTTRTGSVVTKVYQGPEAARRCAREAAAMRGLAGRLPVPTVIFHGVDSLRMGLMAGVHGQELIDAGQADQVLRACGQMLRRIHAIDPALARVEEQDRVCGVLVHGDYGPNNVLLDPAARAVTAVLDWEWAHHGEPVEDLAWCEWIVRMHHPQHALALDGLFGAYGSAPAWVERQQAMLTQCRAMLDLCERWQPGGDSARQWQHRLAVTESWTE